MKSGACVSELKERDLVMSSIKIKVYALYTFTLIDNQSQTKLEFCH